MSTDVSKLVEIIEQNLAEGKELRQLVSKLLGTISVGENGHKSDNLSSDISDNLSSGIKQFYDDAVVAEAKRKMFEDTSEKSNNLEPSSAVSISKSECALSGNSDKRGKYGRRGGRGNRNTRTTGSGYHTTPPLVRSPCLATQTPVVKMPKMV